ncbi:MAG TPA: rhomboid family intramembrane serine protease [Thermoanaerobaculia bacterium]|nr:rhomboid family intramembrane serine protease [Thermoanaerobaculia bacterium]
MFGTKRTGSVLCPACGRLVGVNDEVCYNCGRRKPGMWGLTAALRSAGRTVPFDQFVIGGTVFLFLCMIAVDPAGVDVSFSFLNLLAPSDEALIRFGAAGAMPVWGFGRWWTLLSAGWLHGSLIHIAFNLSWIRVLVPGMSDLYGPARMMLIYTISSAFAFFVSSTALLFLPWGARMTVGASAPILGLLGAMVWYGRRTGSHALGSQAWTWAIFSILIGFILPRVDNLAHIGGFVGGYLAGVFFDPRKPERPVHVAMAIVCLIATLAAIVASLVDNRFYNLLR